MTALSRFSMNSAAATGAVTCERRWEFAYGNPQLGGSPCSIGRLAYRPMSSLLTKSFQGSWPRWRLEPAVASVAKWLIVPTHKGGEWRLLAHSCHRRPIVG